jgi:hypothetical protein
MTRTRSTVSQILRQNFEAAARRSAKRSTRREQPLRAAIVRQRMRERPRGQGITEMRERQGWQTVEGGKKTNPNDT